MRTKKIIFSLMAIFLSLTLLEIGSYIILQLRRAKSENLRNWRKSYENSGLYEDVDLDTYYNEQKTVWNNVSFDFYRYYRPMVNFEGKYISTDNEGFRKTTQHLKNKNLEKKMIVFLGGSTMWGGGAVGDYATIASLFSKYINEMDAGTNYEVKNYGVGGYHNTQEMIVLLEKIEKEPIDFVIFLDWCNESIMGYRELLDGNNESPFLQPSVSVGYKGMIKFLSDRGIYDWTINLKSLIKNSNIVKILLEFRNKLKEEKIEKNLAELGLRELKQAERIVRLYRKNKRIIESLSNTFQFKSFFIMQPNLFTKGRLSNYEKNSPYWNDMKSVKFQRKVYELARKEFSKDNNFYDITDCIKTEETVYLDDYHTSIKGNELIVKAILDKIGAEIIRISKKKDSS